MVTPPDQMVGRPFRGELIPMLKYRPISLISQTRGKKTKRLLAVMMTEHTAN
jgi:hypothetical protein